MASSRTSVPPAPGGAPRGGARGFFRTAPARTVLVGAVVIAVLLGAAYAGMMMPAGHDVSPSIPAQNAPTSSAVNFTTARADAASAASNYGGGNWTPVEAIAINSPTNTTLPGPDYDAEEVGTPLPPSVPAEPATASVPPNATGCGWAPIGGSDLDEILVPAISGSVGQGTSPAWLFLSADPAGSLLVVTVLDGQASLYTVLPGTACGSNGFEGPESLPGSIASGVIDSTTAVADANAWGGRAFLDNTTNDVATFTLTGAYSDGSGYGSDGLDGAAFVTAATWTVSYTNCWATAIDDAAPLACEVAPATFSATIDAANGSVLSASASVGGTGVSPCCVYGPPPPSGGGGGSGANSTPLGAVLGLGAGNATNCTGPAGSAVCTYAIPIESATDGVPVESLAVVVENATGSADMPSLVENITYVGPSGCTLAVDDFANESGTVNGSFNLGGEYWEGATGAGACANASASAPLVAGGAFVIEGAPGVDLAGGSFLLIGLGEYAGLLTSSIG